MGYMGIMEKENGDYYIIAAVQDVPRQIQCRQSTSARSAAISGTP